MSTDAPVSVPCPRRTARSLVAKIVVARGEERFVARSMLAYRRPRWVRGELYDGVGSLRASFLLQGGALSVRLADSDEIISDIPNWSGWDDLLGIPPGSSRLFGLLPLLLDPWEVAGGRQPLSTDVTSALDAEADVRIRFAGDRPKELTVVREDEPEAACTFEGGDGCLAARRFTVDLLRHGVVVWITVEADADFPESFPADSLMGN